MVELRPRLHQLVKGLGSRFFLKPLPNVASISTEMWFSLGMLH